MKLYRYNNMTELETALEWFYNKDIRVLEIKPKVLVYREKVVEKFYVITDEISVGERFQKDGSEDVIPS